MAKKTKKEIDGQYGWEDGEKEKEHFKGSGQDINRLSLKDGDNVQIRILDKPLFFKCHWIQKRKRMVICPGEGCPVCAMGNSPTARYVVNLYNHEEGQIQLFEFGRRLKAAVQAVISEWGDPTKYDIKLAREGEGAQDTRYSATPAKNTEELDMKKLELYDVSKLYGHPSIEYVQDVLDGKTGDTADNEEESKKSSNEDTPKVKESEEEIPDIEDLDVDIEKDLEL